MSDVEKALSGKNASNDEKFLHNTKSATGAAAPSAATGGGTCEPVGGRAGVASSKQHQYYIKPTITANTHYCHETGHIKTSPLCASTSASPSSSTTASTAACAGANANCLSLLIKLIFSTPGLVVLVVAYSVMGAFIFPLLEAPQDLTKSAAIAKSREDCLRELWIITEKLNVLYERNWTMLVHEQLRRFEGSIVAATRHGVNGGSRNPGYGVGVRLSTGNGVATGSTTALGRYGSSVEVFDETTRWSFSEALLYSVTVITTIGHGSLTPKTAAGKIATILYALIGVPLMLMCLSSLGAVLAEALQCTYARICCRLAAQRHQRHARSGKHQHHHHHHNNNNATAIHHNTTYTRGTASGHGRGRGHSCDGLEADGARARGRAAEVRAVGEREAGSGGCDGSRHHQQHQQQQHHEHDCECHGKESAMDCKRCKYDAITGEANLNNGYDYGSSAGLTTMDPNEESCQLLHHSPGRPNQNSACMQLKMPATMTAANTQQYYQQQQRSDVRLMTHQPHAQPHPQQQHINRSATPSPQHFQHHPLQTFHIVASATSGSTSANSSPTHQAIHQYATLQPRQQHQYQQHQQHQHQQQQHFFAVPSNLIRFQQAPLLPPPPTSTAAAANNCTNNLLGSTDSSAGSTNINTNTNTSTGTITTTVGNMPSNCCYQTAGPGGATIYFPIAATAAGISTATATSSVAFMPSSASMTGTAAPPPPTAPQTTATTTVASTQLLCNQPFVKYHTIQLQPKKPYIVAGTGGSAATVGAGAVGGGGSVAGVGIAVTTDATSSQSATCRMVPLPPPPAYQTATVHGVRRAKFLTKPLPQEINTLLAENDIDITCRHDILQSSCSTASSASTGVMGGATSASCTGSVAGTTTAAATITSATASSAPTTAVAATPAPSILGSNTTVDIMEDEEENEQARLGSCPHGTPSRIPLISANAGQRMASRSEFGDTRDNATEKSSRGGLINAKAASFHRHTLHTFHRGSGERKTGTFVKGRQCNVATRERRTHKTGKRGSCWYRDASETSEDDDYTHQGHEQFVLTQIDAANANGDENEDEYAGGVDDADDDGIGDDVDLDTVPDDNGRHVPISIVLLILICYICLGTVIFALWENWSLIDGAYFCFVTLSTIGYGDFLPERTFNGPEVQLFACCAYLLLGLVLVAMSFSILETQLMWKCKRIAVRLKLAKD